ncbi:MAG: Sip1-related alpha-galactosidase [Rikenellaceae bacterium]
MKRVTTTIVAIFAFVANLQAAQSLDLSTPNSKTEIYSATVGGTPQEGVLERVVVTLPPYRSAVAFSAPQKKFDGINQTQPWQSADLPTIFTKKHNLTSVQTIKLPTKEVFFLALELENGDYLTIQPMVVKDVMSWINVTGKNEIEVLCGTMGKAEVESRERPIFCYSSGADFYGALNSAWSDILQDESVNGSTTWRVNKEYPELYKYLGWCSWEQYRKTIDEGLLISAVSELERSEIPVRWVLIDDGHQTEKWGSLVNFEINKTKFPNGWSPILAQRSEKIKWFGLWHCMYGLQKGLSSENTMEQLDPYIIKHTNTSRIIGESNEGSKLFYEMLIGSVSEPGFDFAKVDFQTRSFANYIGRAGNPVLAHSQNAYNLEMQSKERLDGLMNCMAINLPCIFNTRYSATTRVSVDYKLNNVVLAISHIYQSFQNSSWMGQTVYPDHDMFHSSDVKLGRLMAVSKAISAAPVYLSDAPQDMMPELILPLTYADGELLRPLAPGVPLPDSFFADALMGSDGYRVIAPMCEKSAAIVAYNISSEYPENISMSVSASDYQYADAMVQPYPGLRTIPKDGLVYYDWYEKRGGKLQGEYEFDVQSIGDRLILLAEIERGWAVIGLEDKYLSTVAVTSVTSSKKSIDITVAEAGSLLVYSQTPIKNALNGKGGERVTIEALGGDIYRVNMSTTSVTLNR